MLNVLLTGGAGFIGSHTAVALAVAGHRVVVFDNFSNSQRAVVEQIDRVIEQTALGQTAAGQSAASQTAGSAPAASQTAASAPAVGPAAYGQPVVVIEGDVRDTPLLARTLAGQGIDAVVHFAGLKAVGESVAKPIDYYANNVQGTISLLQAMQQSRCNTLVFSSSATVYGDPQYLPLDESHPTGATNPYARSKLHIEGMLADLGRADPAWRLAVLRYFNPVGAHPSGLIGENPSGIPNNLMPYVAQVATGKLPRLKVFGDDYETPDGTGVRDYVHVMDLAEGHLAALEFLTRHTGLHTFNLGTGQGYSVLEIIAAFEAASGRAVPYDIAPRRLGDIASCYASVEYSAQHLGWRAKRSLKEMCESSWQFQVNRNE